MEWWSYGVMLGGILDSDTDAPITDHALGVASAFTGHSGPIRMALT